MSAWKGQLLSFVRACHSQFFQHGAQVRGEQTPSASDDDDGVNTDDPDAGTAADDMGDVDGVSSVLHTHCVSPCVSAV